MARMTAPVAGAAPTYFPCPRCGNMLAYGQLVCPRCRQLVYAQQLNEVPPEAQREEEHRAILAAVTWRKCLDLLPPEVAPR